MKRFSHMLWKEFNGSKRHWEISYDLIIKRYVRNPDGSNACEDGSKKAQKVWFIYYELCRRSKALLILPFFINFSTVIRCLMKNLKSLSLKT